MARHNTNVSSLKFKEEHMKIYDKEIEKHSTAITAALLIIITFLIGFYTGYAISETENNTEVILNDDTGNGQILSKCE